MLQNPSLPHVYSLCHCACVCFCMVMGWFFKLRWIETINPPQRGSWLISTRALFQHAEASIYKYITEHRKTYVQSIYHNTYSSTFENSMKGSLKWRHDERHGASNHQPHDYLVNRLFRRRSKKTSKLCVTGLCVGNSPVTGEFPAHRASNAENVSIWWRHYDIEPNASIVNS